MNEFPETEEITPEQFVSLQVRQITTLSLAERSSEALKLALDLVDKYNQFPLAHRCIAKVYQRMDQIEVAIKHHEIADQLSEEFFKKYNPIITPEANKKISCSLEEKATSAKQIEATSKTEAPPSMQEKPSKKAAKRKKKRSKLAPSFNENELLALRDQLLETTKKDVLKQGKTEIDPIPTIKIKPLAKNLAISEEEQKQNREQFFLSEKQSQTKNTPPPKPQEIEGTLTHSQNPTISHPHNITIPPNLNLKQATCLFRETYIQKVYLANHQNLEKTAEILGVSVENIAFVLGLS